MEQPNKSKRQTGQSVAFYTALVVCLIAVGIGTWQLLQPEGTGEDVSTVSSAVALPEEVSTPEPVPEAPTEEASAPEADVSALKPAEENGKTATDTKQSTSNEKAKSDTKQSTSNEKAKSDTKQSTSNEKAKSDTKQSTSNEKAKSDTKQSTSNEKAKSDTKQSTSNEKAKSNTKQSTSGGKTASASGDTVRPLTGETVTGFSMDKLLYNETMRDWRTHDGIDIAADAGTAVAAAKAGTVESVTADPIMGTTVVIRHADKWETVYSSLADMPEVEAGDEVTAGQVIGYAGDTAASESALGTHLHFAVLNDGTPVDPETFLS